MSNTTTPDLINLPPVTNDDAGLLSDALTALFYNVEALRRTSQSHAIKAVNDGFPATAVAYEAQAVAFGQRLNAILYLANKLGVGIEGDDN